MEAVTAHVPWLSALGCSHLVWRESEWGTKEPKGNHSGLELRTKVFHICQ